MPHVASVTVTHIGTDEFLVSIDETGAGPLSEVIISGIPRVGQVRRQVCRLISGSATTVNPISGGLPDPGGAGANHVMVANSTAAAITDTSGAVTYRPLTPDTGGNLGRFYHRSSPNIGVDNVIYSEYHIKASW